MQPWDVLEEPWRVCLSLAWSAYGAGTIPVGAALVDVTGKVVAEGRNRVYERSAPPGQLANSLLASALLLAFYLRFNTRRAATSAGQNRGSASSRRRTSTAPGGEVGVRLRTVRARRQGVRYERSPISNKRNAPPSEPPLNGVVDVPATLR